MNAILIIEDDDGIKQEINLDKKDLSAIKTLILSREKEIMLANTSNVRQAQENDKVLKRMDKLQWWNW